MGGGGVFSPRILEDATKMHVVSSIGKFDFLPKFEGIFFEMQ